MEQSSDYCFFPALSLCTTKKLALKFTKLQKQHRKYFGKVLWLRREAKSEKYNPIGESLSLDTPRPKHFKHATKTRSQLSRSEGGGLEKLISIV